MVINMQEEGGGDLMDGWIWWSGFGSPLGTVRFSFFSAKSFSRKSSVWSRRGVVFMPVPFVQFSFDFSMKRVTGCSAPWARPLPVSLLSPWEKDWHRVTSQTSQPRGCFSTWGERTHVASCLRCGYRFLYRFCVALLLESLLQTLPLNSIQSLISITFLDSRLE